MSIRTAVLFLPTGRGAPMLFAEWRNKGGLQPVQSGSRLIESGGLASTYFRSLWRASFPLKPALPSDKLANDDGTATDSFWNAFV